MQFCMVSSAVCSRNPSESSLSRRAGGVRGWAATPSAAAGSSDSCITSLDRRAARVIGGVAPSLTMRGDLAEGIASRPSTASRERMGLRALCLTGARGILANAFRCNRSTDLNLPLESFGTCIHVSNHLREQRRDTGPIHLHERVHRDPSVVVVSTSQIRPWRG